MNNLGLIPEMGSNPERGTWTLPVRRKNRYPDAEERTNLDSTDRRGTEKGMLASVQGLFDCRQSRIKNRERYVPEMPESLAGFWIPLRRVLDEA